MAETRFEYGISAGYWSNWGMVHALKEFIANAKDSGGGIDIGWRNGVMVISDDGPGFNKACLQMGYGEAKGGGVIGQFKEGMKGGMLVCSRNGRKVKIQTPFLTVTKASIEPTVLGPDGLVIYFDEEKRGSEGTTVLVECTKKEARGVCSHFAGLRIEGIKIETTEDDRLVSIPKKGKGRVFINSAHATDGNFLFNWNFTEEVLGELGLRNAILILKEAQNRDRTVVDMESLERVMIEVLRSTMDKEIIHHLLTAWRKGNNKSSREYSSASVSCCRLSSYARPVWTQVAKEIFGEKTCLRPRTWFGPMMGYGRGMVDEAIREDEAVLTVQEMGYTPLPEMPLILDHLLMGIFPSISEVLETESKKSEDKVLKMVPKREWSKEEKSVIEEAASAYCAAFNEDQEKFPAIKMFERSYVHADAVGFWYQNAVWLKRTCVSAACESREGFEDLCGTVAHEMGHRKGGHDRSREFESRLTVMLGTLIAAEVRGKREAPHPTIEDVWGDYAEKVVYSQIAEKMKAVANGPVAPKSKGAASIIGDVSEWAYAGMVVSSRRSRRDKYEFIFTSHRESGRKQPALLAITLMPDKSVNVVAKSGQRAIDFFRWHKEVLFNGHEFMPLDVLNVGEVIRDC